MSESLSQAAEPATKAAPKAEKTAAAAKATFAAKLPDTKVVWGKGLAVLKEANPYAKKNLEAVAASFAAAVKGFEAAGAEALAFSQKNFEENMAAAKKLSNVKGLGELIELQRDYANQMVSSYAKQATKISDLASASAKNTAAPLTGRAKAVFGELKKPA